MVVPASGSIGVQRTSLTLSTAGHRSREQKGTTSVLFSLSLPSISVPFYVSITVSFVVRLRVVDKWLVKALCPV